MPFNYLIIPNLKKSCKIHLNYWYINIYISTFVFLLTVSIHSLDKNNTHTFRAVDKVMVSSKQFSFDILTQTDNKKKSEIMYIHTKNS